MKEERVLKAKINAKGMQISVVSDEGYDDYLSLTDIAKYKSEDLASTIQNWMRSRKEQMASLIKSAGTKRLEAYNNLK